MDTSQSSSDPKAAKFLANLKRSTPGRLVREIPEETPAPTPTSPPAPAKPKRPKQKGGDEVSMSIKLDPGTGKRVVYVRVDKTLADRLQLIAMQNKIAGGDGPKTINDIGIEALHEWLDSREHRQAA
ncbi:MAG: hypothetical protein AAF561_08800 [Planctomycetota bacterium]